VSHEAEIHTPNIGGPASKTCSRPGVPRKISAPREIIMCQLFGVFSLRPGLSEFGRLGVD